MREQEKEVRNINWDDLCVIILIFLALGYDLKNYRIPNRLIGIGLLISFLQHLLEYDFSRIIFWGLGTITPILILLPLFLWNVLGAGDIKLFAVIGSFLGVSVVIPVIVISFLIGAILSLIHMCLYRSFFIRIRYFFRYISSVIQSKKYKPYCTDLIPEVGGVMHFTIAIFLAVFLMIIQHT